MSSSGTLGLAKARRMLRRASRLSRTHQSPEAVALASQACGILSEHAERDSRHRGQHVAALLLLSELQMSAFALRAALEPLDKVVRILDGSPFPEDTVEEAADRLADVLTRRGDGYRLLGDRGRAARDLERALRVAVSPLQRAGAHNASGILAKDEGRYADAGEHYDRAEQLLLSVIDRENVAFASLCHNRAGLAYACGDYEAGEARARKAVQLRVRAAGSGSPEVAADLVVLGALLTAQGRAFAAESTLLRALDLWTRHRGAAHYEVAATLHHLGTLYAERGDLDQARDRLRRAWEIKTSVLGIDHLETVQLATQLAQLTARCGAPGR